MVTEIIIPALFAMTWKMMLNEGGLFSFGHALYFGLGAYASVLGWLHIKGLSFRSGIFLAGLVAGLVGSGGVGDQDHREFKARGEVGKRCGDLSSSYLPFSLFFGMNLFLSIRGWSSP